MRISRTLLCIGLLISSAAGMAWSKEADSDAGNEGPTIRNFSLPEYNEKMELVSRIEGDAAKAVQDDTFEITNLRFEMYRSGKVNARVTSPFCTFNKRKNRGWSKSSIRITRDDLVVTGEDYEFNGKKEQIRIRKNAKVVLRSVNVKIWRDDSE